MKPAAAKPATKAAAAKPAAAKPAAAKPAPKKKAKKDSDSDEGDSSSEEIQVSFADRVKQLKEGSQQPIATARAGRYQLFLHY